MAVVYFYIGVIICGWSLSMCFVPVTPHPFFVMFRWSFNIIMHILAYIGGVILYPSIVV